MLLCMRGGVWREPRAARAPHLKELTIYSSIKTNVMFL